jgi:hypothetical protein
MISLPLAVLTASKPVYSTRGLLRILGLPYPTRWEKARPKVVEKIVAARRGNDDLAAAQWSDAKEFLKRNLVHTCITCQGGCNGYQCVICALPTRRVPRSKTR